MRLGVGRQMILEAVHVMLVRLFFLEMDEAGGTVEHGLDYAFVKQQQELGGNRRCCELNRVLIGCNRVIVIE